MQYEGKKRGAGKTSIYYRPSLETFLDTYTDKTLAQWLEVKMSGEVEKLKESIESKTLSSKRRELRVKIVQAAEQCWEKPPPAKNDDMPDLTEPASPKEKFLLFKTTFAPTAKLAGFLFAPWLLSEDYSSTALMLDYKWLKDPASNLNNATLDFKLADKKWIRQIASEMLRQLTDYTNHLYAEKGNGGSVTTWIKAANEWHTARINNELADGSTTRLEHITLTMRYMNGGFHRGITELRKRLGLTGDPHHAAHPELWNSKRERAANRHFHRIVSQSCRRCPISSYMFFPCGLEGMLEHVRIAHPAHFWTGDFHSLA